MAIELRTMGLSCEQEVPVDVYYQGEVVGFFRSDLLVDKKVIVEIKAMEVLVRADEAQLFNYLRSTPVEVGLLFNFAEDPECKRRVFDNSRKKNFRI